MNRDDLKAKLEAQRKWRAGNSTPAQSQPQQVKRISVVPSVLAILMALGLVYGFWALTVFLSQPAAASAPTEKDTNTPIITSTEQTIAAMTVCAGGFDTAKLHVRFEPGLNSEVRGYLEEGETVIVLLGERNEPITKIVDDVSWTFIQSPITGWVSTSHLCK